MMPCTIGHRGWTRPPPQFVFLRPGSESSLGPLRRRRISGDEWKEAKYFGKHRKDRALADRGETRTKDLSDLCADSERCGDGRWADALFSAIEVRSCFSCV